jgi:hypothetical protein
MEEKEGLTGLINEEDATVEVETDGEEEISLKDMITEIVKEVMATMKSEAKDGEEMPKDEEEMDKMAKDKEEMDKMAKDKEEMEGYKKEIEALKNKLGEYENKEKLTLIEKFSMLDSSFIESLKTNLGSYSVEQLEAKLAIEAVRSGVVFNKDKGQEGISTYSVNSIQKDGAPSWVSILEKL